MMATESTLEMGSRTKSKVACYWNPITKDPRYRCSKYVGKINT